MKSPDSRFLVYRVVFVGGGWRRVFLLGKSRGCNEQRQNRQAGTEKNSLGHREISGFSIKSRVTVRPTGWASLRRLG